MKIKTLVTMSIISFLLPVLVWAKAVTFGAEFTFTNSEIYNNSQGSIVNSDAAVKYQELMVEEIKRACSDCKIRRTQNSYGVDVYKVIYPDGWYFVVATDPAVVEVQTKPSTLAEIEARKDIIQKHIFDTAKAARIVPDERYGGGHIHLGYLPATDGEIRKLRNFIVDFVNHSTMMSEFLAQDRYNSATVLEQPAKKQEAFKKIIADLDSGKIRSPRVFINRIHKEVYNYHPAGWEPAQKYQALNLIRIVNDEFSKNQKTLEIRTLEAQKSAAEYITLLRLFQGRVNYLNSLSGNLELEDFEKLNSESRKERLQRIGRYIRESGVSIEEFQKNVDRTYNDMGFAFKRMDPSSVPMFCRRSFLIP